MQTGRSQIGRKAKPGEIPGTKQKQFFERKLDKMKKLFALVLSLALVVAFAVPALASGWAQLDWQIPVYKDISLTLTGLDLVQNTAAVGSLYAPLSTYYPVVKNSRVHFYAEVTLPDANDLSPAMKRLLADWALDLDIAVSGITLDDTFTQYKDKASAGTFNVANYGKVKQGFTVSFGTSEYTTGSKTLWGYECWGTVNADGKDAVVNASIGFYNRFKNGVMVIDRDMDGVADFQVQAPGHNFYGNGYLVDALDSKGKTQNTYVIFPVTGSGNNQKVDQSKPIMISYDGQLYSIVKSTVNTLAFMKDGKYAEGAVYNNLKAVYDKIFGFLGFGYEEANYMTDAHFEHYFGTIMAQSQKITYPNGSIHVNPANPNLPQTGDNASIVGFAMVVVAMVAAAVVTFKKVRA